MNEPIRGKCLGLGLKCIIRSYCKQAGELFSVFTLFHDNDMQISPYLIGGHVFRACIDGLGFGFQSKHAKGPNIMANALAGRDQEAR